MSGHVLRNMGRIPLSQLHSLESSGVGIWRYVSPSMQNPECVLGFGWGQTLRDQKFPSGEDIPSLVLLVSPLFIWLQVHSGLMDFHSIS